MKLCYKHKFNLLPILASLLCLCISITSFIHMHQISKTKEFTNSVVEMYTLDSQKSTVVGKDIPPGKYNIKVNHTQNLTISHPKGIDKNINNEQHEITIDKHKSGEYVLSIGNIITLDSNTNNLAIEKVD